MIETEMIIVISGDSVDDSILEIIHLNIINPKSFLLWCSFIQVNIKCVIYHCMRGKRWLWSYTILCFKRVSRNFIVVCQRFKFSCFFFLLIILWRDGGVDRFIIFTWFDLLLMAESCAISWWLFCLFFI